MGRYKISPITEMVVGGVSVEAKPCRKCGAMKALMEFNLNPCGVGGRHSSCKECHRSVGRQWSEKNKDRKKAKALEWRLANKERSRSLERQRYARDAEKFREKCRVWHGKNPDYASAYTKQWSKDNPEKACVNSAARRARKLMATPAWANKFFIEEIYDLANRRTKVMGFKWHVDHIVPLKSKKVCGLHVECNLQVIPASSNLRKSNIRWPDMP